MNLDLIFDFANQASDEIGKFTVPMTLSPQKLMADASEFEELEWNSVAYGKDELERVPNDKRGVYAFVVCQQQSILPPHGYVLYIGIAGRNSNRPLRERYGDYLNEKKILKRSARIIRMIGNWHQVLRLYFATVDDHVSTEELQKIELHLNTALMPWASEGDLDADTKQKRRAFR